MTRQELVTRVVDRLLKHLDGGNIAAGSVLLDLLDRHPMQHEFGEVDRAARVKHAELLQWFEAQPKDARLLIAVANYKEQREVCDLLPAGRPVSVRGVDCGEHAFQGVLLDAVFFTAKAQATATPAVLREINLRLSLPEVVLYTDRGRAQLGEALGPAGVPPATDIDTDRDADRDSSPSRTVCPQCRGSGEDPETYNCSRCKGCGSVEG